MALQDTTVPYEILIRFDEAGDFKGAHKIERRIVILDGETLKDEPGEAQPLTADHPGGTLWGVLDTAQVTALAAATDLQEQLAEARKTADDLRDDLLNARQHIAALTPKS